MWGVTSFRAVGEFVAGPLHTRHGLRRATLSKQERAFSLSRRFQRRFLPLRYRQASGRGMPRPYKKNRPGTSEERLLLEGKLAQRQLRLMRSKLKIIALSWCKIATFDLIRHAIRRDTFPSRGRLFSVPSVSASICTAQTLLPSGRGMPPPLHCQAGTAVPGFLFSVYHAFSEMYIPYPATESNCAW